MLKMIALGLAGGASVQAWRNWPATGEDTPWSAVGLFVLGIVAAYLAGLWRSRGASAVAVASAEATAVASNQTAVNVFNVVPGSGARPQGLEVPADLDSLPWVQGPRAQVTAADLDGADLSEFVSEHELSTDQWAG